MTDKTGENGSLFFYGSEYGGWSVNDSTLTGYRRGEGVTEERIPAGTAAISKLVFARETALTSVTFPSELLDIGPEAFKGCTGLKDLNLTGVSRVGGGAFADCTGLTRVELNNMTTAIAGGAFAGCVNLKEFAVRPAGLTWVGEPRADGPALLMGNTLLCVPSAEGEYTVPEGVEKIAAQAFARCTKLTKVVMPDSVVSIGESAFAGCTALEEVVLSRGLKSIAKETFRDCGKLKSVAFGGDVKKIGDRAFSGCKSLGALTLPPKLGEVGEEAFAGCAALTLAPALPSSFKKLGKRAFADCTRLEKLVISAKKKAELDNAVFAGCTGLKEVRVLSAEAVLKPKTCEEWEGALGIPNAVVGSLPAGCKRNAVLGFARIDEEERQKPAKKGKKAEGIPEAVREDYYQYIKGQKKKLYDAALTEGALLRLMLGEKMIPQKDGEALAEASAKAGTAEATAALLEYLHRNFKPCDPAKELERQMARELRALGEEDRD